MSQDMSPLSWPDGQPRSEDHDVSSMDIDECTSPSSDSPVASSAATEIGETELTCPAPGAPESRTMCDCCIPETPPRTDYYTAAPFVCGLQWKVYYAAPGSDSGFESTPPTTPPPRRRRALELESTSVLKFSVPYRTQMGGKARPRTVKTKAPTTSKAAVSTVNTFDRLQPSTIRSACPPLPMPKYTALVDKHTLCLYDNDRGMHSHIPAKAFFEYPFNHRIRLPGICTLETKAEFDATPPSRRQYVLEPIARDIDPDPAFAVCINKHCTFAHRFLRGRISST